MESSMLLLLTVGAVLMITEAGRGHHGRGGPPRMNPEWKRWSIEIQEKVCSGKSTEQQLNDLTKCIETMKAGHENREQIDQNVEECLKETETDIGFTVDDANREAVYMICSGKFRMCMHQKIREMYRDGGPKSSEREQPPQENEEGEQGEESSNEEGSEDSSQPPPPPRKFGGGGPNAENFERMMQCKREALEIV